MNEIRSLDGLSTSFAPFANLATREAESGRTAGGVQDQVDISDLAQELSRQDLSPARLQRIARIREQIAKGTYLTADKVVVALHRALEDAQHPSDADVESILAHA